MKRSLFFLLSLLLPLAACAQGGERPFTFAWLSDVHFNSFAYAEDDLRQAIEDINANDSVAFTVISGDVTEFGDTQEIERVHAIIAALRRPALVVPGNHDVNWSENGCTVFDRVFGASNFCHDIAGVRVIGCGAGPSLRMGPPHIPREEILWLDSIVRATPESMPLIFVNHFPPDETLSNWYEVIDILKRRNIQMILCGHLHANRACDFEGISGAIGRSSLRRSDPIGGYNLVTVTPGKLTIRERIIKERTLPAWYEVALKPFERAADTLRYPRPNYAVNERYPGVRSRWSRKDVTDIASQGSIEGDLYVYTNTAGMVHALDARTGRERWRAATGNKIFSAPFIAGRSVVVSSSDGCVYAFDARNGRVRWRYDTGYPVVACPLVTHGTVYVGGSNGRLHALSLADGSLQWVCRGLEGYIEARPAADQERIYIGTWGAKFYAIDRATGSVAWEFDTGRGRYFSPGACWPETTRAGVVVLSSDYFVRAFDPATGRIRWASNEAKGRESVGYSPDGRTLYVKGIGSNVDAVDIGEGEYRRLWTAQLPYRSNFIPTRMVATERLLFIPTEFGVVHALRTDGSGVEWSHKVSHSAVTSLAEAGEGRLIVMTMDGTVACLEY